MKRNQRNLIVENGSQVTWLSLGLNMQEISEIFADASDDEGMKIESGGGPGQSFQPCQTSQSATIFSLLRPWQLFVSHITLVRGHVFWLLFSYSLLSFPSLPSPLYQLSSNFCNGAAEEVAIWTLFLTIWLFQLLSLQNLYFCHLSILSLKIICFSHRIQTLPLFHLLCQLVCLPQVEYRQRQ